MTINEANAACAAQSSLYTEVTAFSKAFRETNLNNINEGEQFEIPQDYKIYQQRMMRNGEPVVDREGNQVTAEFINVATNTGRTVRFYPSSLSKIAFAVDENGKDLVGAGRVVPTAGALAEFVRGKAINDVMQSLKGCTVKCEKLTPVNTRTFGVSNEVATSKDVQKTNVGTWVLVGDKKPAGYVG